MNNKYANKAQDEKYYYLAEHPEAVPFSFIYGGVKYTGFSGEYFSQKSKNVISSDGKETTVFRFDLKTELEIELLLTHYFTHGVTEFTVRFNNPYDGNTQVIERPTAEFVFEGKNPMLKGILGDHVNQYSPYAIDLQCRFAEFSADTGRATHICFPYFNLEHGDGGTMLAIGWAGTWNAQFEFDGEKTTYTASVVNGLKTYLKPGETVRTALFVTAPYSVRNEHYATNFWRSWFVQHNLPKENANGDELKPFSTAWLASDTGRPNSDGSISETYETWRPSLEGMIKNDCKADFRWVDAGWYIRPDGASAQSFVPGYDWWESVGTWELDPVKWPDKTFLESTDFARENGMKTLLWFEPQRVTDPENLAKNYGYNPKWAIKKESMKSPKSGRGYVLPNNIGDPECFRWTTDRVCKLLRENKIEMYREDNNMNAGELWQHLDSFEGENRQGITECKFVDAHYKMWDEIIACTLSFGGCGFVDSCASGGGTNDLESMRRGVPILRSDSDRTTTSLRLSMTHSFNKWVPFCGSSTKESVGQLDDGRNDVYIWRASYLPILNFCPRFAQEPDADYSLLRFALAEWKKVSPYLLKDFYPLTPWHKEKDVTDFTAFVYYDAEKEEGVMIAHRQEKCVRDTFNFSLPFLKKGEKYELTDEDTKEKTVIDGKGSLYFEKARTARLLWIKKI